MTLKEARIKAGITSQRQMAEIFEIPQRTIENWESGSRKCPGYVEKLLIEKLEVMIMKKGIETLKAAMELDEFNNNLPQVSVGDIVTLGDIWDGDGEVPESSYSYKLTDNDWINYEFEFVDSDEPGLDSEIKITGIELI